MLMNLLKTDYNAKYNDTLGDIASIAGLDPAALNLLKMRQPKLVTQSKEKQTMKQWRDKK